MPVKLTLLLILRSSGLALSNHIFVSGLLVPFCKNVVLYPTSITFLTIQSVLTIQNSKYVLRTRYAERETPPEEAQNSRIKDSFSWGFKPQLKLRSQCRGRVSRLETSGVLRIDVGVLDPLIYDNFLALTRSLIRYAILLG